MSVQNGEVPKDAPSYGDALVLLTRYQRDLDGYRLRCDKLEDELAEKQEKEAGATEVREVLDHWRSELFPKAKIAPGSERWAKVKARLKDFEVWELKAVVEGAKNDAWYSAARHRLDAKYIYRSIESVEDLRDKAFSTEPRTLRNGLTLSKERERKLAQLKPHHFYAIEECDCTHLRMEHAASAPPHGFQRCLHAGCECFDFDDINTRAERWKAQQRQAA